MMDTLSSTRYHLLLAGLAFSVIMIVGFGSDLMLKNHPDWRVADDLILGIAGAGIVFRYEQDRSRILSERLRIIRDMNAYVRNELQVLYASLELPEKPRISTIQRSVERIDWALRELLTGKNVGEDAPVEEISRSGQEIDRSA